MSIQPISDIIADVAAAADPAKAQAAVQKLAAAGEADAGAFDTLMRAAPSRSAQGWSDTARASFLSSAPQAGEGAATLDTAKRGLETLLVKMMVESMLPKDGGAVFGKGSSGQIWKSMMSEKLADEMTKGRGLGILQNISLTRGAA